jgi:hypothetical protein
LPAVVILEPDYGAELPLTSAEEGMLGWQQTGFSPQLLDQLADWQEAFTGRPGQRWRVRAAGAGRAAQRPPTSSTAQTPISASVTMLVSRETSAWYGHLHGKGDHPSLLARRYRSHGHRDELSY